MSLNTSKLVISSAFAVVLLGPVLVSEAFVFIAGLVVVGSHAGPLPVDPVARRSVAAMTCPIAIVPHHVTAIERSEQPHDAGRAELVVPTY